MGDEFVFEWTKELGFKKNPFHTEVPKKIDKYFSGLAEERKKLNLFVLEKHPFGTIVGEEGSGKTSMLKWIESQLGSHKDKVRISYINASKLQRERDLIEALVTPLLNVYEKTIANTQSKLRLEELGKFIYSKLKGGQTLLVLLDDVGGLPKRYLSLFNYFFKNKIGVQLIAVGTKKEVEDSNIRGVAEKDWLNIKLDGLELVEAFDLLRKRIKHHGRDELFPFQESMIQDIHKKSDGNPEKFLKLCEEKAIKLALDKEYIKQELKKLEQKMIAKAEEADKPLLRIKLGQIGKKEKTKEEQEEELFDMVKAPDMQEQEEMLAELVEEKGPAVPDLSDLEPEAKDKKEEKDVVEETKQVPKKSKKSKKEESKEAKETEELLNQLAREFENQ